MGFQIKEENDTEEQKPLKKKNKKKYKGIDSESGEIHSDSYIEKDKSPSKTGKSKKRHTTVYPEELRESEGELNETVMNSSSKMQSDSVPEEMSINDQQVVKKAKKKKKEKERIAFEQDAPVIVDTDKEVEVHEDENPIEDDDFYDGWTKEDLKELFSRMEKAIPKNDSFKAASRFQKLDWEQIKFNNYSALDCQEKWKYVEKKVRGYRLLGELLADANAWLEKPWTDFYRSERKNRHPGMPKRPLTSFMLFYMDKKKKFAKKYPNLEMSKLSKVMAEKFHTLSESKREKYKQLAIAMREEYNDKMQKFLEDHPAEALQMKKPLKGKKEKPMVSGPQKPITPFKMFYQDKVKHLKEDGLPVPSSLLLECKDKWKDMSNRKKMPWIRWAHEAEVKYLEEIKLYSTENTNFEAPPFKSVLSKAEKEILDRVEGKPEKPPNSAYSLFSRLMLKDPNIKEKFETPKQRLQEIARLWKEVPKIERDEYAEKVKHLLENYKLEYATYLDSLPEDKRIEELASNVPKKKTKTEMTNNPKKLKQTTLTVFQKNPKPPNSPFIDKEKRTKLYTEKELISIEPVQPPTEPFVFFRDEYLKKGLSEKKAIKAWDVLSDFEKRNYEQKLETAKQDYIENYRLFLKSLKPEELAMYSQLKQKQKNETSFDEEEEEEDEEQTDETTDEEEAKVSSDINMEEHSEDSI